MSSSIEIPIPIRGYDIDAAGIVSNIVYVRWLEDMRTALLEITYPIEEQIAAGIAPVLGRTDITYRRMLTLSDLAIGRMWINDLGRTRWSIAAVIEAGGVVRAEATQTGAFINLATKRPIAVPERLRAQFKASQSAS